MRVALDSNILADAEGVKKDAAHWIDLKQHLPQEAQDMERDYQAIHAVDLGSAAMAVQKASTDWPEKKADLETRLASAKSMAARSDEVWQSSAAARQAAAANDAAKVDFAELFTAAGLSFDFSEKTLRPLVQAVLDDIGPEAC